MPADRHQYYVTTPIYYVNDRPHIGHVYTTTLADILARFHRLCGRDVFFLTGVDEHAAKVSDKAAELGKSPQQWADENAAVFEATFAKLGMSNNDFIRTSQQRHKEKVVAYVSALMKSGDVYQGEYSGWYDAGQEEYVPEAEARKNDFRSAISGRPLIKKTETNYFFALSKYQSRLLDLLDKHPDFVQPEARRNEVRARITEGLNDVPVSRSGTGGWGIAMPGDAAQTIYVWIDALFNYLTTVDTDERRRYWPADVHLIAKDILWFHAVIWPAMLMALDRPLPRQIYAHSFWISEGRKMSKSEGNFIDLDTLDKYVADFSLDALRWYLATQGPLGSTDSDFAHDKFVDVYNSELAGKIGNCASRVTKMIVTYFDGKLPHAAPGRDDAEGHIVRAAASAAGSHVAMLYSKLAVGGANAAGLDLIRAVDTYIEQTAPFKLAKDPAQRERLGTILYHCAESLRIASIVFYPVMPTKMRQLWAALGVSYDPDHGDFHRWTQWGGLQPGATITKGESLFPRVQS